MPEYVGTPPSGPKAGRPWRPPLPKGLKRMGLLVLGAVVIVLSVLRSFFVNIEPYEFGVKEVKIGVHRGIENAVYGPGYAWIKPFGFEKMHVFPRQIQVLELTGERQSGSATESHYRDRVARIQTSDGFYVDVDVTILYRLIDPYKVMTKLGPGKLFLTNGILPKAEPILKQTLGELKTEEFYNSPLRRQKTEQARAMLNTELEAKGIQVEHVLVRYFRYSDEIQKNIEAKKLQDQLVFKNQAEARAATENANLMRVRQEGEMRVAVTKQEGEAYKTQKASEKELYMRTRAAEGQLLTRQAEAEAVRLKNDAMQVGGNDRKVAMAMAEVLKGLDTVLVPTGGENGVNPLDLDEMLRLFNVVHHPAAAPANAGGAAQ